PKRPPASRPSPTRRSFILCAGGWLSAAVSRAAEPDPATKQPGPAPLRIPSRAALARVVQRVEPVYPQMARGMGVEGEVIIDVLIGPDGEVAEVRRIDGHPVLGRAAEEALERWRFEPLTVKG